MEADVRRWGLMRIRITDFEFPNQSTLSQEQTPGELRGVDGAAVPGEQHTEGNGLQSPVAEPAALQPQAPGAPAGELGTAGAAQSASGRSGAPNGSAPETGAAQSESGAPAGSVSETGAPQTSSGAAAVGVAPPSANAGSTDFQFEPKRLNTDLLNKFLSADVEELIGCNRSVKTLQKRGSGNTQVGVDGWTSTRSPKVG